MPIQGVTTVPQLCPSSCVYYSSRRSSYAFCCSSTCSNGNFCQSSSNRVPSLTIEKGRKFRIATVCNCLGNKDISLNFDSNSDERAIPIAEWDWDSWSHHFSEIEKSESYVSLLKFQLEDAIEKEDFVEAAKLKNAISQVTAKDSVAGAMLSLKSAVEQERYIDASQLSKCTGSELIGWWVGYSNSADDPFGKLVRISPGVGRFVARSFTPRQLLNSSQGIPLFEIFVIKDNHDGYVIKVVCLQRAKRRTKNPTNSSYRSSTLSVSSETEKSTTVNIVENEPGAEQSEKTEHDEDITEEDVKGVINFLKDKLPGLKVKVMNVKEAEEDINSSDVKQRTKDDDGKVDVSESSTDEADKIDEFILDEVSVGPSNESLDDEKEMDMKFFISGVVHNTDDLSSKEEYVRLPAEIADRVRDSFVLHIPEKSLEYGRAEREASKVKVAAIAAKGVSELMPPDIAKAFFMSDKLSPKLSRNVREIVKLAVNQAQKQSVLSEYTSFNRIDISSIDLDPFQGLYVGVFGPFGMEVVQLRRRYGNWNDMGESISDLEFFEYVEAVKLTGDYNIPAGKVIFRAKIGKGRRNANRGMYPDDLGVVASYKGQGRLAEFGFKNPRWVEGELLQLNGKGIGSYISGADLGFLYTVPEHSFLVLLNRLKLPE